MEEEKNLNSFLVNKNDEDKELDKLKKNYKMGIEYYEEVENKIEK